MLIIEHLRELSLAATSLSKVDNMFNSKSIFNTKCAKFSTKWYAYLYIQLPHNLHQKFVPSLQPTLTFPFHLPYTCSQTCSPSLRFSPILPSSNSAVFKLPLFTDSHSYNLFQKLFPYHNHLANSGCIK